jgi:hypothetical protein
MPDIPQIPAFNITSKLQSRLNFSLTAGTRDPLVGTGASLAESLNVQQVGQNANGTWNQVISEQEFPVKDQNETFSKIQQDRNEAIQSYEDMASIYDSDILNYNNQINQKKAQIISLVNTAIGFGCSDVSGNAANINGVACGIGSTIRQDEATMKIYSNLTNYSSSNPFKPIVTENLSSSNIGKGFENNVSNNTGAIVGTNYRFINGLKVTLFPPGTSDSTCISYRDEINTLASEIATLRGQRDQYLSELNSLKNLKTRDEIAKWGSKKEESTITAYNAQLQDAIQVVSQFTDSIVTDQLIVHFDSALESGIEVSTTPSTTSLTSSGIGYNVLSWNNLSGDGLYADQYGSSSSLLDPEDGPSVILDDSSSQYFSIDNSYIGSGKIEIGSSSYSIESWVKITSDSNLGITTTTNGATIVGINSIYGYGMQVFKPSGIRVSLGERNNGSLTNNTNLNLNTWYHVVGINQAGVGSKIYLNGILDGTGSEIDITSSLHSLNFGYAPEQILQYFSGKLSVIRIYNKALTDTEVSQNFNAHKARYGY